MGIYALKPFKNSSFALISFVLLIGRWQKILRHLATKWINKMLFYLTNSIPPQTYIQIMSISRFNMASIFFNWRVRDKQGKKINY